MDVTVEVKGLAALEARLQELDALAGSRLLTRVLRKVAQPMAQAARSNAASFSRRGSSGALARSVAVVTARPKGAEVARVSVTSKAKDRVALYLHNAFYGRRRRGIFYGWMVEKGHKAGSGYVAGNPWFWPAVQSTESAARDQFIGELSRAGDRIERRKSRTASPDTLVTP